MGASYRKRKGRGRERDFVRKAGPVTVTKADGSQSVQPSYSVDELLRIDRRAAQQPRTWDEINSTGGGGHDRHKT